MKKRVANGKYKLIDINTEDRILRTFILFVQTAQAVLKYADAYLYRKAHLSVVKLITLRGLSAMGGTMTMTEIARWTQSEQHNITTLVSRLKRDGLVRAERSKTDKRLVNVILTDKGQQVLDQSTQVAREIVNQVMLSIGEGNAVPLEKQLRIMRQNAHHGLKDLVKRSQP